MEAMKTFTLWLIDNIPDFLLSEPVIYFVSVALLAVLIKAISQLFVGRR